MTKKSPTINFDALSQQKPTEKPKKQKKRKKKEKPTENTRDLRFEQRKLGNYLTFFFFSLFFAMAVVLLMVNSRLGEITKVAHTKAVNTEEIALKVQEETSQVDSIVYQGEQLLNLLFSFETGEQAQQKRKENIQPYLAKNLSSDTLLFSQNNTFREVKQIAFIQSKALGNKKYSLLYAVGYTEKEKPYNVNVELVVSYKNKQFQLINKPIITTLKKPQKEATDYYEEGNFYQKGEEVSSKEEESIQAFLQSYFEMYVSNDERLSLISNVSGLGTGKFNGFTMNNLVKVGKETYSVQGEFSFINGTSQLSSPFSLQLKVNKDSYFVEKFNAMEE